MKQLKIKEVGRDRNLMGTACIVQRSEGRSLKTEGTLRLTEKRGQGIRAVGVQQILLV